MQIKDKKHYFNKFFLRKIYFSALFSLIPATLLFTDIFFYAKIAVVFISLIPLTIAYFQIYKPYKKFIHTLSFPSKKVLINIHHELVSIDNQNMKIYQIQFCDDPQSLKHPCEFTHDQISNKSQVECFLFDDGKTNYISLLNFDESFMALVRINERL